ncbi:DNA-binding protein [Roseateles sp. DB2]
MNDPQMDGLGLEGGKRYLPAQASPAAAKRTLQMQGLTLREFARMHGFKYRTVSEVIRGVNKGLYGEGHRVALALGLKQES